MNVKLRDLPDYEHCLVNLANSILKKFGAKTTAATLPLTDQYLDKDYKNVVVLLLDAMGISILEKHLVEDGFFRSHLAGAYDSVYPPTTVAATTSILSGLYPNEHGWLGWDMYYPQLDKNVTVFTNQEQLLEKTGALPTDTYPDGRVKWAEDSLVEGKSAADFNAGFKYTPYRNIVDLINDAGGRAYAAMPFCRRIHRHLRPFWSALRRFVRNPKRSLFTPTGTSQIRRCTRREPQAVRPMR